MKIAILTSGILPVPAIEGGAVENLIDYYLEYNEREKLHRITVFSVLNEKKNKQPLVGVSSNTQYVFFRTKNYKYKILRKLFGLFSRKKLYYYFHTEYYLHLALKQLKQNEYDIILLENRPGYAEKVANVCPQSRIVLHLHNNLLNAGAKRAESLKSAISASINVSEFIKKEIDSVVPPKPSYVCYNGIDLVCFHGHVFRKKLRGALGLSDSDFVIVFSGRLIPEKGAMELLKAFGILIDSGLDMKLLVIGGNFYANDVRETPYMEELHELAGRYAERVVFTGFRTYSEIPGLLKSADVAAVPSLWEDPCPLSCIEAMASGLPLVATRSGGIPELVNEECAIILEKGPALSEKMADSILQLYHQPERRLKMGAAAKERSRLFDKDIFAKNFFELLAKG